MHHFFISNNSVTICPRFYIGNWHIVIFKAAPPLGSYFGRPTGIGEQHTEMGGREDAGANSPQPFLTVPWFPCQPCPCELTFYSTL